MKKKLIIIRQFSIIIIFLYLITSCNQIGEILSPQSNSNIEPEISYTQTEILVGTITGTAVDNYDLKALSSSPIRVQLTNKKLIVINFTPVTLSNVNLKTSNNIVLKIFDIPAWTKITFDEIETTNIIIPENQNPIMKKFNKIKTKWSWVPHNYNANSDSNANWQDSAMGEQLRKYFIMNYNMAYFLSSDFFVQIMTTNNINDLQGFNTVEDVIDEMRDSTRTLRIWITKNYAGLGGGNGTVHGMANYVINNHSTLSIWINGIWTGANVWFHEFAHCFGFSHNSNIASNWFKNKGYPSIQEVVDLIQKNEFIKTGDILFPPN